MGDIIKAECKCGFKTKQLFYGAGMMDEGICNVPALKNKSKKIEMKNIWKRESFPEYTFYTDTVLFDESVPTEKLQAWENYLHQSGNFCPNCGNYDLEFISIGLFD